MTDITQITKDFGRAYEQSKTWDTAKEKGKKRFFAAATQELAKRRLPQKTVTYEGAGTDLKDWIARHHPGWRLISQHTSNTKVVLEQDPALMKFSYPNPEDHTVYARTIVEGGPMLDDERLREENPDLWEEITEWPEPMYSLIYRALWYAANWSEDRAHKYTINTLTTAGVSKIMKDPSTWTSAQAAAVQPYMLPGPISVKLVPPRPATAEDLESLDD